MILRSFGLVLLACVAAVVALLPLLNGPGGRHGGTATHAAHAAGDAPHYSASGHDVTALDADAVAGLAGDLDAATYRVTQEQGTERAFTGALLENKAAGTYTCTVCGLPLYSSSSKFKSGTGWPSFTVAIDRAHVTETADRASGMVRTEINCARCGSHLGHVFDDGPAPTGMRHCVNSVSLQFIEEGTVVPEASRPVETETAYFAGGCFWGVEHYFQKGDGVIEAASGYMQGTNDDPTYKEICRGNTGHAETVKVVFDPKRITFERLLEAFFVMHDPTQLNRQGPDFGTQYRSGIWTTSAAQKEAAVRFIARLTAERAHDQPIVTEVEAAKTFYPAEDYHQDYIVKTGRRCHVRDPWTDAS